MLFKSYFAFVTSYNLCQKKIIILLLLIDNSEKKLVSRQQLLIIYISVSIFSICTLTIVEFIKSIKTFESKWLINYKMAISYLRSSAL